MQIHFQRCLTKKKTQPKTYSWPTSNFFNCFCSCWESSKQKWEYVINTVLSDVSVCSTIKSIVQSLTLISILFFQGSSENVDTKKLSLKVVPYLNGSWIGKSVQSYLSLFMWIQTLQVFWMNDNLLTELSNTTKENMIILPSFVFFFIHQIMEKK